jgi:hypothetical protein
MSERDELLTAVAPTRVLPHFVPDQTVPPRRGKVAGATASRETARGHDVLASTTNRIHFSW